MGDFTVAAIPDHFSEVQDYVYRGPAKLETTNIPSQPALLQPTAYQTIKLENQRSAELEVNSHSSQDSDEDSDSSLDIELQNEEGLLNEYGRKVLEKMPKPINEAMLSFMFTVFQRRDDIPIKDYIANMVLHFNILDIDATEPNWTRLQVLECYHLFCSTLNQPFLLKRAHINKLQKLRKKRPTLRDHDVEAKQVELEIQAERQISNNVSFLVRE